MSWDHNAVSAEKFPTAHSVGAQLSRLSGELDQTKDEVRSRSQAAVKAKREYKLAWAKCYAASIAGSHAAKAAEADGETLELAFEADMAAALYDSAKSANKTAIAKASLAQSWAATVRSEMELTR